MVHPPITSQKEPPMPSHPTPVLLLLPILLAGGACAGVATAQQATFQFSNSGQKIGSGGQSVALGDLDGDGDLDAVVANGYTPPSVLVNDGTGSFTAFTGVLGDDISRSVALGDLDGDGDLDAMVANFNQPNTVWTNDGTGTYTFTNSGQALGNGSSRSIEFGDLDGDGDLDAMVANTIAKPNTVWINNGDGDFSQSPQELGNSSSISIAFGDFDGDGDLDAMVANFNQLNVVWTNDGTGIFTDFGQSFDIPYGYYSYSIALGDLDEDGDLDAMIANYGNPNVVWSNNGDGTFNPVQSFGSLYSSSVALDDFDGDGDLDAMIANGGAQDPHNSAWINDGLGNFSFVQELGNYDSTSVALGDLDGDGDPDALFTNGGFFSDPNTVWTNESDRDADGVLDDFDGCPDDPNKTEPGNCGCGTAETTVFGDLDCDGDYDADDIRLGMVEYGIVEASACPADLNADGEVDGQDLAAVLAAWGLPCGE